LGEFGPGTIGQANLNGRAANQSFITGAIMPAAVAINPQHVYGSNSGANAVGVANLEGSPSPTATT